MSRSTLAVLAALTLLSACTRTPGRADRMPDTDPLQANRPSSAGQSAKPLAPISPQ